MKKIDRVKPVKRYRVAKYPSHADPDPTTYPVPVPFPFHREFVRAVAGVGLAATLGFASQDAPKTNPFPLAKSGLPHETSPFGTGQPSYLQDEAARGVIEKIFKEGGFKLQRDLRYDRDGVAFRTGGYDPERKVGYVFGTWETLDEDAIVSWIRPEGTKAAETAKDMRAWLRERVRFKDFPEALRKRAEESLELPDGEALTKAYQDIRSVYHADRLSLKEGKALEERAIRDKEYIAVVSQFDPRFHLGVAAPGPEAARLLKDHQEERDPAKREALLRKYHETEARAALEVLERNVREFLDWARSQGLR